MQVRGIHHVNVNVTDLAAALRFYVDGMGFTVLPRPDIGRAGAWLGVGAHQLHLAEAPDAAIDARQHFALHVDDLDACVADLEAKGIAARIAPTRPGAGRQAFLKDPSGNRIELNEPGD
ncbi:MAG: VOC family protein [Acidimicrobiia bacterium]